MMNVQVKYSCIQQLSNIDLGPLKVVWAQLHYNTIAGSNNSDYIHHMTGEIIIYDTWQTAFFMPYSQSIVADLTLANILSQHS